MAKDFIGQEINVGDTVVYMQLGYRYLRKGEITKITDKCVIINDLYRQFHNQVVKVQNVKPV